jgi:hypothetical protein
MQKTDFAASFVIATQTAIDAAGKAKGEAAATKSTALAAIIRECVAQLATDDAATIKSVTADINARNKGADVKPGPYCSAMNWRMDSATVAALRAAFGDVSRMTLDDFTGKVDAFAVSLGDVWADYKRRDTAVQATATRKAEAERAKAIVEAHDTAPVVDPIQHDVTVAMAAIRRLMATPGPEAKLAVRTLKGLFSPAKAKAADAPEALAA